MPDAPGSFHRLDCLAAGSSRLHAHHRAARPTVNERGMRPSRALPGSAVLCYHGTRPAVKPHTGLKPLKHLRFRPSVNAWASTPKGAPQ
jgi:hypothetical protein